MDRGRSALEASMTVILDAVFLREADRSSVEGVAGSLGLEFAGVWLGTSCAIMKQRVGSRTGDTSDTAGQVIDRHLQLDLGSNSWHRIDSSGSPQDVFKTVRSALAQCEAERATE